MGDPVYALHAPPLRWRSWDENVVVHHDASGSTHLLDPLSAAVLRSLEGSAGPVGVPQLAEDLARESGLALDDEMRARVAYVLEEFVRLGLAERAP